MQVMFLGGYLIFINPLYSSGGVPLQQWSDAPHFTREKHPLMKLNWLVDEYGVKITKESPLKRNVVFQKNPVLPSMKFLCSFSVSFGSVHLLSLA